MKTGPAKRAVVRCAIYTRKSSEEGLDQAFNSLHAQREACEAFVKSQASEGWKAMPTQYDDGGLSGGTLERPALQRLLADIDAGRIDTIVVYKVDRLTRALGDFAKIVDRLDAAGASFVSVTQAFNTTTSMGRLTLNVLLSFAQFEREVTGERIRDKIAQSKAKGMWMGGRPPLGYDPPTNPLTRALVVNEAEAEQVRMIYGAYLELGSVHLLERRLAADGVRSKAWRNLKGEARGDAQFSRGALFHLLKSRLYLGEIPHGALTYPGSHPAIVDPEVFDQVQARLAEQRRVRRERPTLVATMALRGVLFDIDGSPMCPSFTYGKGGRIHRYYVSAPLQQGRAVKPNPSALRRIAAGAVEELLRQHLTAPLGLPSLTPLVDLLPSVRRIEIEAQEVRITLLHTKVHRSAIGECQPHDSDPKLAILTLPIHCRLRGGQTWITPPAGSATTTQTRRDPVLIRGLRDAHQIVSAMGWRPKDGGLDRLKVEAPVSAYQRRLCILAFLAPDLQQAILDGRQPPGINLETLYHRPFPPSWAEQRVRFNAA